MYSAAFTSSVGILAVQVAPQLSFAESVPTSLATLVAVMSGYGIAYRRARRQSTI
ncbi:MAG: hypothetical protein GY708_15270 [Actinomycetia bacterium]|nr:hypothetical protein [Actinomycetes bacterium]